MLRSWEVIMGNGEQIVGSGKRKSPSIPLLQRGKLKGCLKKAPFIAPLFNKEANSFTPLFNKEGQGEICPSTPLPTSYSLLPTPHSSLSASNPVLSPESRVPASNPLPTSHSLLARARQRTLNALWHYIIPFGFLIFLTGLLFASSRSAYKTMVYVFLLLPVLIAVVLDIKTAARHFYEDKLKLLLLVYLVYAATTSLWNVTGEGIHIEESNFFKHSFFIALFFYGVSYLFTHYRQTVINCLLIASYATAVYCCYAIWEYGEAANGVYGLSWKLWQLDTSYNRLVWSSYIGFYGAFLVGYVFTAVGDFKANLHCLKKSFLPLVALFPILSFVVFTWQRTPLIALSVTSVMMCVAQPSLRKKWIMAVICLVLGGVVLVYWETLMIRGLSYRPEIWWSSFMQGLEYPLFGHGAGSWIQVIVSDGTRLSDPHNIHLSVFYHTGFIGLIMWLILWGGGLKNLWSSRQLPIFLVVLALAGYGLLATFTEGGGFLSRPKTTWFFVWLPLALASSRFHHDKKFCDA